MMISQKMADAINDQIIFEFYSGWVYLSMAYQCEAMGLKYMAQWLYKQEAEERFHATKMSKYLIDQGAEVKLTQLDATKTDYKDVQEIVETAVEHEVEVTKRINNLVTLAREENDHATDQFLQWYVEEQVEEVASTNELLDIVKLAVKSNQLLMLEHRVQQLVSDRAAESAE